MKLFHNIKVSVFVKEDEEEEIIVNTLVNFFPFNLKDEKIKLDRKITTGFDKKQIIIFEVVIEKDRYMKVIIKKLVEKLSNEQKGLIVKQAETRIDEDCNFFIRLDKEKLIDDKYRITDSGNCFHFKFCLAVFPKEKKSAVELVKKIFN